MGDDPQLGDSLDPGDVRHQTLLRHTGFRETQGDVQFDVASISQGSTSGGFRLKLNQSNIIFISK